LREEAKQDRKITSFIKDCLKIVSQLKEGVKVQESSSFCLQFMVQDMLDFAQIKQGKFRKKIDEFNIIEAVNDVMLIQQRKAKDNKTKLYATFVNIEAGAKSNSSMFDCMICTDIQRVMQVLLCLQSNALKFTQGGEVQIIVEIKVLNGEH
jgi:signal transduction histidine kinase